MRVLIASGIYPPKIGGPSAQTEQIARALLARGVAVRVVTWGEPEASGVLDGIPVTFLPRSANAGVLGKCLRDFRAYRLIARVIDEFDPDVVHQQTIGGTLPFLTGLAARRRGVPSLLKYTADYVVEMSDGASLGIAGAGGWRQRTGLPVLAALQKILLRLHTRIWATTAAFAAHLRQLGVPPAKVLQHLNCVDLRAFEAVAASRLHRAPETIVLLTVARLIPLKGIETSLAALAHLRDRLVRLRLVGSGTPDYEAHLREIAQRLGVADRVEFAGPIAPAGIPEVCRAADIFVLASHYEPFGIVLLEAMAAGLPVVATATGGIPEVVEDGVSGCLVAPGDADALAAALRRLIADPAARAALSRAARARAAAFSLDALVDRLAGEYESLARGQSQNLARGQRQSEQRDSSAQGSGTDPGRRAPEPAEARP